jgi:hypothetical protein
MADAARYGGGFGSPEAMRRHDLRGIWRSTGPFRAGKITAGGCNVLAPLSFYPVGTRAWLRSVPCRLRLT